MRKDGKFILFMALLWAALLLAGAMFYYLVIYMPNAQAETTVPVLVAKEYIPEGTSLTIENMGKLFELKNIDKSIVVPALVTDVGLVENRELAHSIYPGEFLMTTRLEASGLITPEGNRELKIATSDVMSVETGEKVRLYVNLDKSKTYGVEGLCYLFGDKTVAPNDLKASQGLFLNDGSEAKVFKLYVNDAELDIYYRALNYGTIVISKVVPGEFNITETLPEFKSLKFEDPKDKVSAQTVDTNNNAVVIENNVN